MATLLLFTIVLFSTKSYQQRQEDGCSFINGQGCMNGICKFCAMCVPSSCILATPYSTGNNEGSTCKATHQTDGYDFYNYCLSTGTDDDGDFCNTSTQCYQYRQSNNTSAAMHNSWDNLTCDSDTCLLVNFDGTEPVSLLPLDNNTIITPTHNSTDSYHPTTSGNDRNKYDIKSGSATSIALTCACIVVSLCLIVWLIKVFLYKSKYWPTINRFFCCGYCAYTPKEETPPSSSTATSIPNSSPPSFHSSPAAEMRNNNNGDSLPNYFQQDPSPPKYEQAIVTQIRGMSFFDHHPPPRNNNNGDSSSQPIWVPIYLSSSQHSHSRSYTQDWATQTMRHYPTTTRTRSIEEEEERRR